MKRTCGWIRTCAVACLACGIAVVAGVAPLTNAAQIEPDIVWNGRAVDCDPVTDDASCFTKVMRTRGASSEAIRFAELLVARDDPGWAIDFRELGRIDLLTTFHPYRANTNESYFLMNGTPELVAVEPYEPTSKDRARADFQQVLRRYPSAFFAYKLQFVGPRETADGSSRFVFQDTLAECRACEPLAVAEIAYEFDPEGNFKGARLLRTVLIQAR